MKKAFTLMELIIVVVIVGILASFGVPTYFKTVQSAKEKEAVATIKLIATAAEVKILETNNNQTLNICGNPSSDVNKQKVRDINSLLKLALPVKDDWHYCLTPVASGSFSISATNLYSGCLYQYNPAVFNGIQKLSSNCVYAP